MIDDHFTRDTFCMKKDQINT